MKLSLLNPTPLEYFRLLVQSDTGFPLLEAAISLAQDEYPLLDVEQVLAEIDHILERVKRRIPADAPALQKLRILNQFFFMDLGFGGNLNDYYDPDNSYVSVVLRSRRGIPISLAVLWLELAQGVGLQACGLGFPGHFMVKVNLPKGQAVIDPFTGQSMSRESLAERLEPYQVRNASDPDSEVPLGLFLQCAAPRDIIERMLRNLKEIHKTQEDWSLLVAVLDRLLVLVPDSWADLKDRGLAHAELNHTAQAVQDLQTYLDNADPGVQTAAIAMRLVELQRMST